MKRGFTLVELLIVIVIIGILVTISIPNFIKMVNRAKDASLKENMHILHTVVEYYSIITDGIYPGGIDTKTGDLKDGIPPPDNEKSIAGGRRIPPFPKNALLLPHSAFKNPFVPSQKAIDNLFEPEPVSPSGCTYYTGYKENGEITNEGEPANFYKIKAYGSKGPLPLILP